MKPPAPEPLRGALDVYLRGVPAVFHPTAGGGFEAGWHAALAAQEAHPAPIPRNVLLAAYEHMIRGEAGEAQPAAAQEQQDAALTVRCPFCGSREWPADYAGQGDHK